MATADGVFVSAAAEAGWSGPGAKKRRKKFRWSELVWALVWPRSGERIMPTVSGVILIALCFGVGTAAYNSSSNILFITLSLLLACSILSGVLSWMNLSRVAWRLDVQPPLRAGQTATVGLALRNGKKFLPTYGLWFEWAARPLADPAAGAKAESTVTGKGIDVRAILKKVEAETVRGQAALRERLEPRGEARLDLELCAGGRGRMRVELAGVGRCFPWVFGEYVGTELGDVVVWPAAIEYRRLAIAGARRAGGEEQRARGRGRGFVGAAALCGRRFAPADPLEGERARGSSCSCGSPRRKAAKATRSWVRTDATLWPRRSEFEVLVSFAATLAEDLFAAGSCRRSRWTARRR